MLHISYTTKYTNNLLLKVDQMYKMHWQQHFFLPSTSYEQKAVRNSLLLWNLSQSALPVLHPVVNRTSGFELEMESAGLCELFSGVLAGYSVSCCFNPSAPALRHQWGPCLCVFSLERHSGSQSALLRTLPTLVHAYSHTKNTHTDKRWLMYAAI